MLRKISGFTRRTHRAAIVTAVTAVSLTAGAAAAPAQETAPRSSGAVVAPGTPEVSDVVCVSQCVGPRRATPGATIKVKGVFLDSVTRVVFHGPDGPIKAKQKARGSRVVRAVVPKRARAGRPYVIDAYGKRSNRSPRRLAIAPVSEIPREVFPVRGPHGYGDGFGAGRGHDGTDVFASCGTRMVSALTGRVQARAYHSAAGNYVVIDTKGTPDDLMYAHLTNPAAVQIGQRVQAGQFIGYVGDSGNAQGCHLHFEYWSGDWYNGGSPIPSMDFLKRLDRKS